MTDIDLEQVISWKQHPVTQRLFELLNLHRNITEEDMTKAVLSLSIDSSPTKLAMKASFYRGYIKALDSVLNLKLEDEEKENDKRSDNE